MTHDLHNDYQDQDEMISVTHAEPHPPEAPPASPPAQSEIRHSLTSSQFLKRDVERRYTLPADARGPVSTIALVENRMKGIHSFDIWIGTPGQGSPYMIGLRHQEMASVAYLIIAMLAGDGEVDFKYDSVNDLMDYLLKVRINARDPHCTLPW